MYAYTLRKIRDAFTLSEYLEPMRMRRNPEIRTHFTDYNKYSEFEASRPRSPVPAFTLCRELLLSG